MELLEAIQGRRAVRTYAPRPVPREVIHSLLEAAVQAPSAMNAQPWAFAVVQDLAALWRISEEAKLVALAGFTQDAAHHGLREALASPISTCSMMRAPSS